MSYRDAILYALEHKATIILVLQFVLALLTYRRWRKTLRILQIIRDFQETRFTFQEQQFAVLEEQLQRHEEMLQRLLRLLDQGAGPRDRD